MAIRNLAALFVAQLIFVGGAATLVTLGGIIGNDLAPSKSLATLPMSLMVVGTALGTVPAALLMQRIGRRLGFFGAACLASCSFAGAAYALSMNSFLGFCIATTATGLTLAFSQQFRFAAAESVSPERVSYAISFILLGSIGGAFLGPALITYSAAATPDNPYQNAMLGMATCYAIAAMALLALRTTNTATDQGAPQPARALGQIVRQPLFIVAVLGGMIGQGVMTYVMTATPLSMHVYQDHDLVATAEVIRAHIIAMYLPSLVTAPLISWLGTRRMMQVGVFAMIATLGVGLAGHHVMHYWWSMVLLGVGWNFLYVGGTTLLVRTYQPQERYGAQAVNEFGVFTTSAMASLLAGTVLYQLGWSILLLTALPLLILMLVLLVWSKGASIAPSSSSALADQPTPALQKS